MQGQAMPITKPCIAQFVGKIYSILNDQRYEQFVRWGPEGTSFIILNSSEFSDNVLAKHFKHSNISSFVRQLNKYDFHKVPSSESTKALWGPSIWEFKHRNFQRGRPDLISHITRKRTSNKTRSSGENDCGREGLRNRDEMLYKFVEDSMASLAGQFDMVLDDLAAIKTVINGNSKSKAVPSTTALVAEDNACCSSYAVSILRRSGVATIPAESVKALHFHAANATFKLILISSVLPSVPDILNSIRMLQPAALVILTVDEQTKDDTFASKHCCVDKVLQKPFAHDELLSIVRWLELQHMPHSDSSELHYPNDLKTFGGG